MICIPLLLILRILTTSCLRLLQYYILIRDVRVPARTRGLPIPLPLLGIIGLWWPRPSPCHCIAIKDESFSAVTIGVEGRGQLPPPPNSGKTIGGKHRVIFGQLIYFWKKEEQAPFIFHSIGLYCFSFHVYVKYNCEF